LLAGRDYHEYKPIFVRDYSQPIAEAHWDIYCDALFWRLASNGKVLSG